MLDLRNPGVASLIRTTLAVSFVYESDGFRKGLNPSNELRVHHRYHALVDTIIAHLERP
jgi:hypothetical protein